MYDRVQGWMYALEHHTIFAAVKKGFLLVIPIVLTGSFALLIRSFPIPAFQEWLAGFGGGFLLRLMNFIFDSTSGFVSLYLVLGISYYYSDEFAAGNPGLRLMAMTTALACFIASFGGASGSLELESFGTIGVFTAMLCSILATKLFFAMELNVFRKFRSYAAGADIHFRSSMTAILPMAVSVAVFAVCNLLMGTLLHVANLNDLISTLLESLFGNLHGELANGVLFTFLQNLLWIFGIHGGNALDTVAQTVFTGDHTIISKSFLDNFAVIGGSGTTVCLLLALILVSKVKSNRNLVCSAAPLGLFNINEILVFGLPIVQNPVMFLPFILVPVISLIIAYTAVAAGFMPPASQTVTWTTPVFFSGYLATGSWRGMLVQLIILTVGTGIYLPFVKLWEKIQADGSQFMVAELTKCFRNGEEDGADMNYLSRNDSVGMIAKAMAEQLRSDVENEAVPVCYQPQVDDKGRVIGAEALLRWKYKEETVYPPLVISLAREDGCYEALTWCILTAVCRDLSRIREKVGADFQISANIVAEQLNSEKLIRDMIRLATDFDVNHQLVLEVTEETSLVNLPRIGENIELLSEHGIYMAIDDFSMGQTSLKYLRSNRFRYVKLDGSLVRQIVDNARCREIVGSIISLGKNLGFRVVAEWVENEEIRNVLLDLGCTMFQGYLYSPAVPFEELVNFCISYQQTWMKEEKGVIK